MAPLLEVVHLSKSFGTLPVLTDVSFEVHPGEVLGLMGWSGAGKSVIAALLAGVEAPDEGEIRFAGRRLVRPFQPRSLGIEIIHQQPELVEPLDITSAIFLGRELCWSLPGNRLRIPDRRRMDREALRILDTLGLQISSLRNKVVNLSSEQRQVLAIAQVMVQPARLIVVDEPTDRLSYKYQQRLLTLILDWHRQGVGVLFSSKNLDHMFAVTDRIIVLRQGHCVATHDTDDITRDEVVNDLLGTTDRQQLTPAIWALDSYAQAREQAEKLRHQQMLLEQSLAAQGTLNQQLLGQLAGQVKALDQANLALQDAQRRLLTEREQERKHLARELHDQIIQDLLSVNYRLEDIEADAISTAVSQDDVVAVRNSIRSLIDELRRICGNLRPPTIDSLGLGAALQSYSRLWSVRTDTQITIDVDRNLGRLPEAIELSIFRIVQEGLNNVRKHAQASAVEVRLRNPSPRTLVITIADNGRGLADDFDLATIATEGHYGLLGLSERVALLGGRLRLKNQPAGGLFLQVEIPHPRADTG